MAGVTRTIGDSKGNHAASEQAGAYPQAPEVKVSSAEVRELAERNAALVRGRVESLLAKTSVKEVSEEELARIAAEAREALKAEYPTENFLLAGEEGGQGGLVLGPGDEGRSSFGPIHAWVAEPATPSVVVAAGAALNGYRVEVMEFTEKLKAKEKVAEALQGGAVSATVQTVYKVVVVRG